jgi:hypothetical protein
MAMLLVIALMLMVAPKSRVNGPEGRSNDCAGGVRRRPNNCTRNLKWRFNDCNRGVYRNPDYSADAAGQYRCEQRCSS